MAKIQIKSEKLTPIGGIFSIMEKFDSMLSPVIDSTLHLVVVNKGQTGSGVGADLTINGPIGEIFAQL